MRDINFIEGSVVGYAGENWRVAGLISLDLIQLEHISRKLRKTVAVRDISPPIDGFSIALQQRLPFGDSKEREEAIRMMELIRPLLDSSGRTKAAVRKRALEYGVSEATAYRLIAKWEQYGRLEALARGKSHSGKGGTRLAPAVEEVIQAAIPLYLNRQRYGTKDIAVAVRRACEAQGLPLPHLNTIRNRIRSLSNHLVAKTRLGRAAAMKYEDHSDPFDRAEYPLSIVEIDHSVLDVTLVDDEHRLPIGRDVWITLALDVYSRMVVGYYVSLDPVGDVSTGMCVAHSILAKDDWLKEHQIKADWPCWGPMDCIHVDNAREFRGKMLRRACERYGIEINFRPVDVRTSVVISNASSEVFRRNCINCQVQHSQMFAPRLTTIPQDVRASPLMSLIHLSEFGSPMSLIKTSFPMRRVICRGERRCCPRQHG